MQPAQIVRQLAPRFGIQVRRMKVIQDGVFRIVTRNGNTFCLKRMAYPPVRLRWIDLTLHRLRSKGFKRIAWRNRGSRLGSRLYARGNYPDAPPFVLIPWLKGSFPSPRSNTQMRACGTLLARFHQAGNRIAIPKAGRHNGLGSWPAYLRSERNKMLRSIRKAKRNGFGSPLDSFLQKHGNEILRYANISLRALQSSNYRSLCRKAKRTLCHGDCGPSNIIRTRKGMYLLDFETMRIDLRAYDLYRIIYNSCKDHRWNFAIARSILDGYQKVFKLGRSDYRMLKMLLLFPREACKLIQEYSRITPRGRLDILKFFPRTIANERRRLAFIKKLDAYARKH